MLADFSNFKKIIEVFECISLDHNAYFTFQNQDNIKVCVQYEKGPSKKDWSIWFDAHENNSKQIISSQHLSVVINAFKIDENNFINEIANVLLLQAAFADELIRQVTELFGKEAVQKSILETQNFMDGLAQSVEQVFKADSTAKMQAEKKGLRVVK